MRFAFRWLLHWPRFLIDPTVDAQLAAADHAISTARQERLAFAASVINDLNRLEVMSYDPELLGGSGERSAP